VPTKVGLLLAHRRNFALPAARNHQLVEPMLAGRKFFAELRLLLSVKPQVVPKWVCSCTHKLFRRVCWKVYQKSTVYYAKRMPEKNVIFQR